MFLFNGFFACFLCFLSGMFLRCLEAFVVTPRPISTMDMTKFDDTRLEKIRSLRFMRLDVSLSKRQTWRRWTHPPRLDPRSVARFGPSPVYRPWQTWCAERGTSGRSARRNMASGRVRWYPVTTSCGVILAQTEPLSPRIRFSGQNMVMVTMVLSCSIPYGPTPSSVLPT